MKPIKLKWTPKLVAKYWDGFSQTRLVEYSFSQQAGRSVLIAVDHLLPRDGRLLDFGAGDGHLVRLMLERGLKVAAYEPSAARLETQLPQLADYPGFLGVTDGTGGETYDAVIATEVIEHILDQQLDETLERLAALTRPGGTLIVTTPNDEDLELGMVYCPVSNLLFHRWQHVRSFTHETLCELLDRFGFDEVVTHHIGFDDAIFVPTDSLWGQRDPEAPLPDYIANLRRNEPTRIGSESNLLCIGRKRTGSSP